MVRRRMSPLDDLDEPMPLGLAPRTWLHLSLAVLVIHIVDQIPGLWTCLLALAQGTAILGFIVLCAEAADAALRWFANASGPRPNRRR